MKLQRRPRGRNPTSESIIDKGGDKSVDDGPSNAKRIHVTDSLQDQPTTKRTKKSLNSSLKSDNTNRKVCLKETELVPTHLVEPLFKCTQCEAFFLRKEALISHMQIHSDWGAYFCPECGISFAQSSSLSIHLQKHSSVNPYQCQECNATFKLRLYLQRHLSRHTEEERPFKCNVCGDSFKQHGGLLQHSRTHTGVRPHKCKFCGKGFSRSYSLRVHEISHSGLKPFKCLECGDRFTQRGNLLVHMRRHSGEKPHKCAECGKAFAHSQSLQVHLRGHSGIRPYECKVDGCTAAFADSGTLYKHRLIHSKVMPHGCMFCNLKFAQRANMKRHIRVVHKIEIPKKDTKAQIKSQSILNTKLKSTVGSKPKSSLDSKSKASICSKPKATVDIKHASAIASKPKLLTAASKSKLTKLKAKTKEKQEGKAQLDKKPCKDVLLYHCKICSGRFAKRGSLVNHMRCHNNENLHNLPNLPTENEEEMHLLLDEDDEFIAQRENLQVQMHSLGSGKLATVLGSLNKMSQDKHTEQSPRLQEHNHEAMKPFKCGVCGVCFAQKDNLQTHACKHSSDNQQVMSSASLKSTLSEASSEQGRRRKQKMPVKMVVG